MAAPPEVTTLALSGTFIMNKGLSDPTDKILELQGVGWFLRRIISVATVTLHIKHYKDDQGVEHIDIKQTLTGGFEGNEEDFTLDWTERFHDDKIFGQCIGKSRRLKVEDIKEEFLKKDWLPDTHRDGAIESYVVSDTERSGRTWTADQIWGFEQINEERRYTRHVDFTGPKGEKVPARLIYDYVGKLQE